MKRDELEARALAAGVSVNTMRMRIYRESARRRPKPPEPHFETFGLVLSKGTAESIETALRRMKQATHFVNLAGGILTRLLRGNLPVAVAQLEPIEAKLYELINALNQARPAGLCPWCKGLDALQDDCKRCGGTGCASVAQFDKAPARLKDGRWVVSEGREVPLADFAKEARPGPFDED